MMAHDRFPGSFVLSSAQARFAARQLLMQAHGPDEDFVKPRYASRYEVGDVVGVRGRDMHHQRHPVRVGHDVVFGPRLGVIGKARYLPTAQEYKGT